MEFIVAVFHKKNFHKNLFITICIYILNCQTFQSSSKDSSYVIYYVMSNNVYYISFKLLQGLFNYPCYLVLHLHKDWGNGEADSF